MTAFLRPEDDWNEWQYECQREKDYYQDLMDECVAEATRKMGEYTELVCEAFTQDCRIARKLFEEKGLKAIHAYAVNKDYSDFMLEYDEQESYTQEFEE